MSQLDQHPTTEQLSTWLDQQLTPEEQAYCSTHLEECEQCQHVLDNLQQTVNLLRSLPQLEVPRSFTLSNDFQITADRNKQVEQSTVASPRRIPTPLRRTLRAVSALAAVIGLFFTLSGLIAPLQLHSGSTGASSMSAPSTANLPPSAQQQPVPHLASNNNDNTSSKTPNKAANTQQTTETNTTATGSLFPFDFNQAGERLSIGIVLAIVGGVGFVSFAQRQKRKTLLAKRN